MWNCDVGAVVKQCKIILALLNPWRWCHCNPPKCENHSFNNLTPHPRETTILSNISICKSLLWEHPHIITSLSISHHNSLSSSEHPSSHRPTGRSLKPRSSILSLPLSPSCWLYGPFRGLSKCDQPSKPCLPNMPTNQWQSRLKNSNLYKKRPHSHNTRHSEGVIYPWHFKTRKATLIYQERRNYVRLPATMPHGLATPLLSWAHSKQISAPHLHNSRMVLAMQPATCLLRISCNLKLCISLPSTAAVWPVPPSARTLHRIDTLHTTVPAATRSGAHEAGGQTTHYAHSN